MKTAAAITRSPTKLGHMLVSGFMPSPGKGARSGYFYRFDDCDRPQAATRGHRQVDEDVQGIRCGDQRQPGHYCGSA